MSNIAKPKVAPPGAARLKQDELILQGTIIYGDDFQPIEGYISIRDGIIKEAGTGQVDADFEGIVCPRFVNSHIHLGDSAFKDPPFLPLSELVGPKGLKISLLSETPRERLIEGMRRSLAQMVDSGTYAFADFREGGEAGVRMLQEAAKDMPLLVRVFGRPAQGKTETPEGCYGLGISSTRDYDPHIIQRMILEARRASKAVAIHAGESARDDIPDAFSLLPDHLVHMSRAEESDLRSVAGMGTPLVICPRSNLITGSGLPNVKRMIELGITVGVGTDNVMLNSPNMFMEMHLISRALLHDDRQVFKMCTLNGAEIMGLDQKLGSIREGKEAKVMVINGSSDNLWGSTHPLRSIVRRAEPTDILAIF
jgi:cytosine/adenosine deaminase-related metal-dependent hydrolase